MDDKLAKDILLICKHRFNTEKYTTALDAMNAYYHKHYGNEDLVMDYKFVCKWLIGTDDTDKHDDWLNWLPLFQDIVGIIEVNKFMLALSDYDMRVER